MQTNNRRNPTPKYVPCPSCSMMVKALVRGKECKMCYRKRMNSYGVREKLMMAPNQMVLEERNDDRIL